jgi:hypothetical protein
MLSHETLQHFSCGQSGSGGSSQLLQHPPELHSVILQMEKLS